MGLPQNKQIIVEILGKIWYNYPARKWTLLGVKGGRGAVEGLSKSYYLKPVKIIRDAVHGYVNLTKFDLKLIDTVQFQRLGDVRQLTCQHVYPGARHTRFEHSLGVLELMRSAIKYLNRNGILGEEKSKKDEKDGPAGAKGELLIDESLEFNASVAALLHDVGHCPFSHMGETQFDKDEVFVALVDDLNDHIKKTENQVKSKEERTALEDCRQLVDVLRAKHQKKKKIGAIHEQLSCIVILRKYRDILTNLEQEMPENEDDTCIITVDLALIIRSILGIEYSVGTTKELRDYKIKNAIVRLLNSQIFDVDKLDYIMRDSAMTGIGTPTIDTQRLFRNMYLDDKGRLIFTSKAVPALQNMIDARDGLYMYVYNHHAVVYSDFLNTYISLRLSHNYEAMRHARGGRALLNKPELHALGLVPKDHLFSVEGVVERNYSDSAWLAMLNCIHMKGSELLNVARKEGGIRFDIELKEGDKEQKQLLKAEITRALSPYWHNGTGKKEMAQKIYSVMRLVHQYMTRNYLKPWWKTVFEFSNFMERNFQDDRVREQAEKFICSGGDCGLKADELRSQIAKHVTYITRHIGSKEEKRKEYGLIEPLHEGDFFVIQRTTNFFSTDSIEKLEIALKSSEILGMPGEDSRQVDEYYLKKLTSIIPQKDYESVYAKEGFYIFSKQPRVDEGLSETEKRKRLEEHYKLLEDIFVFVVKRFVSGGEQEFIETFQGEDSADREKDSKVQMYKAFKKHRK